MNSNVQRLRGLGPSCLRKVLRAVELRLFMYADVKRRVQNIGSTCDKNRWANGWADGRDGREVAEQDVGWVRLGRCGRLLGALAVDIPSASAQEGRHMCHIRNTIRALFESSALAPTYSCRFPGNYEK